MRFLRYSSALNSVQKKKGHLEQGRLGYLLALRLPGGLGEAAGGGGYSQQ